MLVQHWLLLTNISSFLILAESALCPRSNVCENNNNTKVCCVSNLSTGGEKLCVFYCCSQIPDIPAECTEVVVGLRNNMTILMANSFPTYSSFLKLTIGWNKHFSEIQTNSFQGLSNLRDLSMKRNSLRDSAAGMFAGLHNLETLDLSDNYFFEIKAGMFEGLTNLQILQLQNNNLALIEDGAFKQLESLQSLYLASNKLVTLGQGTFIGMYRPLLLSLSEPCYKDPKTYNCTRQMCWLKFAEKEGNITWRLNQCGLKLVGENPGCVESSWEELDCNLPTPKGQSPSGLNMRLKKLMFYFSLEVLVSVLGP